jgi:hypothetical protein
MLYLGVIREYLVSFPTLALKKVFFFIYGNSRYDVAFGTQYEGFNKNKKKSQSPSVLILDCGCEWVLAEQLERLTASANVPTVLSSIPASSDTVESIRGGR